MEDDSNDLSLFFLGLGLGVAAGLLFAPRSGAETRDLLMSKVDDGREYLLRSTEGLRDQASDLLDKGKDAISQQVDRGKSVISEQVDKGKNVIAQQRDTLNAAVEAGKQAYRETVGANNPNAPVQPA